MPMTKQFSLHTQVLLFTDQMVGGRGREWNDFDNKIIYFSNKRPKKTNKYINQKYFIY
jgi:hypothetical protein